jgi:glycosyltransferase involved in cell wall biosynthesis
MAADRAPLVSVIVAAYNPGPFLNPAIESVLEQTLADFELIVVDDGSWDDTLARLASYPDPRLRVIVQSNQGAPAALNRALGAARGTYIGILDHDDVWLKTKLARHVEFFEGRAEVDATFSWSRLIDASGRDMGMHMTHWHGPIGFRQLFEDYVVGDSSSIVLRRAAVEAVAGFDGRFPRCYDVDLLLRIALLRPNNVCAVPEELTLYRRHNDQMSRDWRAMRQEWEALVEKCRGLAPEVTRVAEGRSRSNTSRYLACLAYERGEFPAGCRLMGDALRHAPRAFFTDLRNWKTTAACLAGLVLPAVVHRGLERLAGVRRP